MTDPISIAAHSSEPFDNSVPIKLAYGLAEAREQLQLLLLSDIGAAVLLLERCLEDSDWSDIVGTKNADEIIVQLYNLVHLLGGQNNHEATAFITKLVAVPFFPGFLVEISDSVMAVSTQNEYRLQLEQAVLNLRDRRQQMISANLRLVAFAAYRHKTASLSFDDLMQEGVVGLIKAVDRFDPFRGFQFSTYALPWIRQAISRLIVKQEKSVRLPISLAERACAVFEAMNEVYQRTERWPTVEQLKQLCDLSEDDIKLIRSYYQATQSLEQQNDDDEGLELMARMQQRQFALPLDELTERNLSGYLDRAVSTLPEREATVLNMRFGLRNHTEMTLQAIADRLQLSRERVRQIQSDALKKLKAQFGNDLMPFLEPNDSY